MGVLDQLAPGLVSRPMGRQVGADQARAAGRVPAMAPGGGGGGGGGLLGAIRSGAGRFVNQGGLGVLGGALMDLGGGQGNMNTAMERVQRARAKAEHDAKMAAARQAVEGMAGMEGLGDVFALDPGLAMGVRRDNYRAARDQLSDRRYEDERDYSRDRDAVADARFEDQQQRQIMTGDRDHDFRVNRAQADDAFRNRNLALRAEGGSGRVQSRTLSAVEVAALGLPQGSVVQENSDGKLQVVNRPPKTPQAELQKAQAVMGMRDALKNYAGLIEAYGPQVFDLPWQKVPGQVDSARNVLMMQLKELFNLGVLNGPDLALMEKNISDPTGFHAIGKTKAGVQAELSEVENFIAAQSRLIDPAVLGALETRVAEAGGGSPPPGAVNMDGDFTADDEARLQELLARQGAR